MTMAANANDNVAIGRRALYATTESGSVAVGAESQMNATSGQRNVSIGFKSLDGNTSNSDNTAIGDRAGELSIGSDQNTYIGSGTGFNTNSLNNSIAIGYGVQINSSNSATIGNSSVTSIGGYSGWSNLSDKNFKNNVKQNVVGLDFILGLRPVTYTLDVNKLAKFNGEDAIYSNGREIPKSIIDSRKKASEVIRSGFIAQEVEATAKKFNYDFNGVDKPTSPNDHYSLRYAKFVVPLVKSIQEQQQLIQANQKLLEKLKMDIEELEKGAK